MRRPPRQPLDFSEMSADKAAIIQKAMREEPAERYATGELFIADLDSFQADRPVWALCRKVLYVAKKCARRHRLAAGFLVAAREREVAQRRFEQVKQASRQFQEMEGRLRRLPGATKERNDLVLSALQNLERLAVEARPLNTEMVIEISNAYLQVARVPGVPTTPNLGKTAEAERSLVKAESLVAGVSFNDMRARNFLTSEIAQDRMILAEMERRRDYASALAAKTVELAEAGIANRLLTPGETAKLVRIFANATLTFSNIHCMDEAAR